MASAGSRNAKGRRRGMTTRVHDGQRHELIRTKPNMGCQRDHAFGLAIYMSHVWRDV
jgi:hypothetical protein